LLGKVERHPGRTALLVVGVLVIWLGVAIDNGTKSQTLLIGGLIFVLIATVGSAIRRIGSAILNIEFGESDVGELGSAVEQMREERPDPAGIDLPGRDEWDGAAFRLGEQAIDYLLTNLSGSLVDCEARLYLYDKTSQRLMPAFTPSTAQDSSRKGWKVGQGVTGLAYEKGKYVYAWGDTAHDDTYGLTPEMQQRYEKLTAVAAAPLTDRSGKMIGILSLSSTVDGTALASEPGYKEHLALAQKVAVALVDLLHVTD
jgi:hypothetical protein